MSSDLGKLSRHQVGEHGRSLVVSELEQRGASGVRLQRSGRCTELVASDRTKARTVTARVKTKSQGNWHTTTAEGASSPQRGDNDRFWVLVDLGVKGAGTSPAYFVMPDQWLRNHITKHHAWWLEIHGGTRPVTPSSQHVAIEPAAVEHWRDRWDVLGMF